MEEHLLVQLPPTKALPQRHQVLDELLELIVWNLAGPECGHERRWTREGRHDVRARVTDRLANIVLGTRARLTGRSSLRDVGEARPNQARIALDRVAGGA